MMTYEEALNEIQTFVKFGSKLGLSRMTRVMELLGNPQDQMKVIHVAGTNGKGSVCRGIYSMLRKAGYKTGLYTSPFLEVFNERIEFDGCPISDFDLSQCTGEVMAAVHRMVAAGEESPTEFEVITAIAFVYFSKQPMDFLVLEVGLGGTGDSTNIIKKPAATIITSISYDHMEYLGDTLEKIAIEKAGILKEGCPIVYSVKDRGAAQEIQKIAAKKNCNAFDVLGILQEPCITDLKNITMELSGYSFDVTVLGEKYPGVHLAMAGIHQVENACCALAVIEILKKGNQIRISKEAVYEGLRESRQIGRFEVLQRDPYVIIDGAHNDDGARALVDAVRNHFLGKRILLICGILADKEVDKMIGDFAALGADMAATEPENPRRLPSAQLCARIKQAGYGCVDVGDFRQALQYGKKQQSNYDLIIYAGSLYLIGKIREGFRIGN